MRADDWRDRDEDSVETLLRAVDHETPPMPAERVIAAARARAARHAGARRRRQWLAVGLGTVGAAALAAAVPSTRFGRAVVALVASARPVPIARPIATHSHPASVALPIDGFPTAREARVEFHSAGPVGEIRVHRAGAMLRVSAAGGTDARYTVQPWGIAVESASAGGGYDIDIAPALSRVRVVVNGATVFTITGGAVTLMAPPVQLDQHP